jgi:hypothetical protein
MSPSRLIHVGTGKRASTQIVTTKWVEGKGTHAERHEHVTLETPKAHSNTAKLRILSLKDAGRSYP